MDFNSSGVMSGRSIICRDWLGAFLLLDTEPDITVRLPRALDSTSAEPLLGAKAFKRTDDRWGGIVWYIDEKGKRKSFSNTTVINFNHWLSAVKISSLALCPYLAYNNSSR